MPPTVRPLGLYDGRETAGTGPHSAGLLKPTRGGSGAQVILKVGGDRERRVQEAFDRQHALVLHRTAPHRTAPQRTALLQPVHYGHFETNGRACSGL